VTFLAAFIALSICAITQMNDKSHENTINFLKSTKFFSQVLNYSYNRISIAVLQSNDLQSNEMTIKLGILMDPIEYINTKKDSS